jgi:hypothetical protein
VFPQVDHVVWVLNDTTSNWKVQLVSSSILKSMVSECMNNFWLVGLRAWWSSGYLVRIYLNLMSSHDCRNNKTWEVFSRETSLDKACTVIDNEIFLLVEENLHIFKSLLNCSHLIYLK